MKRILSLAAAAILALGVTAPVLASEAGTTVSNTVSTASGSVYSHQEAVENYNGQQVDTNLSVQATKTVTNQGLTLLDQHINGTIGLVWFGPVNFNIHETSLSGNGSASFTNQYDVATSVKTTNFAGSNASYQNYSGVQGSTTSSSTSSAFSNF